MKNLKLSFALIIAVLAVGVTVAANANVFGKRVITRCFTQISLKAITGTATATLDATVASPIECDDARNQVLVTPLITSATLGTSLDDESTCTIDEVFCCAKVTEITDVNSAEYQSAPFVDLGEGNRKYKIASDADVFCKIGL